MQTGSISSHQIRAGVKRSLQDREYTTGRCYHGWRECCFRGQTLQTLKLISYFSGVLFSVESETRGDNCGKEAPNALNVVVVNQGWGLSVLMIANLRLYASSFNEWHRRYEMSWLLAEHVKFEDIKIYDYIIHFSLFHFQRPAIVIPSWLSV